MIPEISKSDINNRSMVSQVREENINTTNFLGDIENRID